MKSQMNKLKIFLLLIFFFSAPALGNTSIWVKQIDKPVDEIYDTINKGLEAANFYVVFEPNIGKSISRFSERWGSEYNQNKLSQIRSMVFCNGWYANQVSNADPEMLALCPLHITLIEKEGKTKILFVRPSAIAKGTKAEKIALEIEENVIRAIEAATATKQMDSLAQ